MGGGSDPQNTPARGYATDNTEFFLKKVLILKVFYIDN